MSEFDELENMFSNAFSDEKVIPPKSVKQNIDRKLFGSNGKVIWLFALLLLFLLPIGGLLIYNQLGSGSQSSVDVAMNEESGEFISSEGESGVDQKSINASQSLSMTKESEKVNDTQLATSDESRSERRPFSNTTGNGTRDESKEEEEEELQLASSSVHDVRTEQQRPASQEEVQWEEHNKASLLALENVNEKPLPYDLLFMCATQPPVKTRQPISIDVYAGVENGTVNYDYDKSVNTLVAMDRKLTEELGASVSLEVSYPVFNRFSLATGLGVHRGINTFSRGAYGMDSTYTGDTLIVTQYFDTVNQVQVVDSNYVATYDYNEYETLETTQVMRTTYFLPIYLKYEKDFGVNWRLGASVGLRFSYDQIKLRDNTLNLSEKEFKRFGMSAILRPEIGYQLNRWNFGAYGQVGYDLIHGLSSDITRVTRYSYGGGLRFRYTF